MSSMIEVNGLRKEFTVKSTRSKLIAVDDVSFSIDQSQTYGLIGESGSGKTTVGRLMLKLIEPTAGTLTYNGTQYEKLSARKFKPFQKKMQMVFQDPYYSLNPKRTLWETVYSAYNEKKDRAERNERVKVALDRVQIYKDDYDKYPHQISMGQQQRVGIARAIVSGPSFIVLDEPTSALDLTIRAEIMELLNKLQEEMNISYLFISHDLSTIQYMCKMVSIMYLGQIVESGTVDQVFNHCSHPYSIALLGSVMHTDPTVKRSAYSLSGEIPSPIDLPEACYLATRCPEAKDVCFNKRPPLIEIGKGHTVLCHNR